MNRRFLVAIVVGILAIIVAMNMAPRGPEIKVPEKPVVPPARPVVIFRATQDIKPKTEITADMFKVFNTFDTDEAFIKLGGTGITSESNLVGKVATTVIKTSTPFTTQNLAEKQLFIPKRLSEAIPAGKRAITIAVTVIQSVGGFVREGDYVDIVGIFSDKSMSEPIRTILSGVQVLSIGSELPTGAPGAGPATPGAPPAAPGAPPGEPQTSIKATPVQQITFAATPEESEIITLVSNSPQKMTFCLLLRAKVDFDPDKEKESEQKKGTAEIALKGETKEVLIGGKAITKKEALEIFAGGKQPAAMPAMGGRQMSMDPRDPNFNPDLMDGSGNMGGPLRPVQQQMQNQAKPAATVVTQPVETTVEMYKGINKSVITVK